ncbi:MAG: ribonuclease HI family protein [Patescibacteria group bacterium]|uniref:Ribonuclease HI family protein n=1 Tax=candidate division WWE3 bacterium TaxID=2053526 RepID=A0A955EDB4_UNCKA|nr:ribonuclease HI family protein [candidate division WWE3 bacterium]
MKLFTDGGARGNPGPAGVGVVILEDNNDVVYARGAYIGHQTNNFAEYYALLLGLTHAKKYTPVKLVCHLDSELVVKQLNGEYKVKNAELAKLHTKVITLAGIFNVIEFVHVPRKQNAAADKLVNDELDLQKTLGYPKISDAELAKLLE